MNFPNNLRYNKDYSWVKIEDDIATIGLIEYSAKKVEEFVFIMLPSVNQQLKENDVYVTLEAVKWSGHLTTPVEGEILEVNEELFNEPSKINEDPYDNWIIKVRIEKQLNLMDTEEAKKYYESK